MNSRRMAALMSFCQGSRLSERKRQPQHGLALFELLCIAAIFAVIALYGFVAFDTRRDFTTACDKIGDPVFIDTLTKGFARARDIAKIKPRSGMNLPSLHEVRSLALRLYRDAYGSDFAQNLAGHKDVSTTNVYTDVRGSEWIEVRIA